MVLDKIVDYQIPFYAMAVVAGLGLIGKLIAQITLKRMIREAENIHGSSHKLMKLIKAKYEHANMVSDRVKNVTVFVDKYLYEYRVLGMAFYAWQSMEMKCMWIAIAFGLLGASSHYLRNGMGESVFQYIAWTGVVGMLLFLVHIMTNAKRKMEAVRTYIVDYLENVCAHRYAKMAKQEIVEEEEEKEPVKTEVLQEEVALAVEKEEAKEKEEKRISQEIRIREILEEFLA